jgi:stalled ribosome alternative rescue factor ArfA
MSHPVWYTNSMKNKKPIKARVNKDGLMGSKSRVHRAAKGKGSYRRKPKHP